MSAGERVAIPILVAALLAAGGAGAEQRLPYTAKRTGDRLAVTVAGGETKTYEVRYERSPGFGTAALESVVRDPAGERTVGFNYREAEPSMELVVDGRAHRIEIQSGIVTVGDQECDGAGGDWSCIARAVDPLVQTVPTEMLLAVFELVRTDLSGQETIFGPAVTATFQILIGERLAARSAPPAPASPGDGR